MLGACLLECLFTPLTPTASAADVCLVLGEWWSQAVPSCAGRVLEDDGDDPWALAERGAVDEQSHCFAAPKTGCEP